MSPTAGIPFRSRSETVPDESQESRTWTRSLPFQNDIDSGQSVDAPPPAGEHAQPTATPAASGDENELSAFPRRTSYVGDRSDMSTGETNTEGQALRSEATAATPVNAIPDIDSAHDMELRLSNEFIPIKEDNWDTVLYIGPPLQQHGDSPKEYEYIQNHFSRPYLMRSQTLRDSGSKEFADRLGPMSARVERKLRKLGLHNTLPNDGTPKYWIDLRPMQNDDEALITITELTCTPGVLNWHNMMAASAVDPMVIKGKDKLNTPKGVKDRINLPADFFSRNATALQSGSNVSPNAGPVPSLSAASEAPEADYSPLRHHSALERLLHALAGNNPRLNSAPKMWTFFSVARLFGCATHTRVSSEIFTWIFSGSNSNFIAANPEVCYRIALGTQSKMLLRVVFCILVGEKALHQAIVQGPSQPSLSPTQTRNRALSHLDDDEVNRIDHAARSLSLRVQKKFQDMLASPITWMTKSTEIFKLFSIVGVNQETQDTIIVAIDLLFQHVCGELLHALSHSLKQRQLPEVPFDSADPIKERGWESDVLSRYNPLTLPQRLLSQVSWTFIKGQSILVQDSPFHTTGIIQWDGIMEVWPRMPPNIPWHVRALFETKIAAVNNGISDGSIHYHDVHSHRNILGDYEIRWDALFAATSRNCDSKFPNLPEADRSALLTTAHMRQKQHREGVQQYEKQHPTAFGKTGPPDYSGSASGSNTAADLHYTTAKIDCYKMWSQLSSALKVEIQSEILRPGYLHDATGIEADINVDCIDTLLCLNEDEFKFLPLWADGCDDGSGGVFTEAVPGAIDVDFQGGKRGLGSDDEGLDGLDDVEMGESFSVIDSREAESTVAGASKVATAGYGTDSVMSLDE